MHLSWQLDVFSLLRQTTSMSVGGTVILISCNVELLTQTFDRQPRLLWQWYHWTCEAQFLTSPKHQTCISTGNRCRNKPPAACVTISLSRSTTCGSRFIATCIVRMSCNANLSQPIRAQSFRIEHSSISRVVCMRFRAALLLGLVAFLIHTV